MSTKKKTAAQYAEDVKKAEARVKALKKKAAEATKAEQAQDDVALLSAVREWAKSQNCKTDSKSLTAMFKRWTEQNKANARQQAQQAAGQNGQRYQ